MSIHCVDRHWEQYSVSQNWASGRNRCLKSLSLFTLNVNKKCFTPHHLGHNASAGLRRNGSKRWWVKVLLISKTFPQKQTKSVEEQNAHLPQRDECHIHNWHWLTQTQRGSNSQKPLEKKTIEWIILATRCRSFLCANWQLMLISVGDRILVRSMCCPCNRKTMANYAENLGWAAACMVGVVSWLVGILACFMKQQLLWIGVLVSILSNGQTHLKKERKTKHFDWTPNIPLLWCSNPLFQSNPTGDWVLQRGLSHN